MPGPARSSSPLRIRRSRSSLPSRASRLTAKAYCAQTIILQIMKLAGDKTALCIERPGMFLYKSAQAGNTTALCIER